MSIKLDLKPHLLEGSKEAKSPKQTVLLAPGKL